MSFIEKNEREYLFNFGILKLKITRKAIYKKFIVRFLDLICPKNKRKIVGYFDGGHYNYVRIMYDFILKNHSDEFEFITLVSPTKNKNYNLPKPIPILSIKGIYNLITSKYVYMQNANLMSSLLMSKRHIYLNVWHGMPLKTIGFTEKNIDKELLEQYKYLGERSYFFVTSDIFKVIMAACFKTDYNKIFISGLPKNDYIGKNDNNEKIKKYFDLDKFKKVVFYLPTWRNEGEGRSEQVSNDYKNIFSMTDYDENGFLHYLKNENILFLMKPHPLDEQYCKNNAELLPKSENFRVMYNEELRALNIDFYEMFKFVDCLISDYSSVTIDYLILNKPVIFLFNQSDEYTKNRGLILEENSDILMPGAKVKTYFEFENELKNALVNDNYKEQREKLLPLIHKYRDFNSCDRIYNIIKDLKQ